eukprot:gene853-1345_t
MDTLTVDTESKTKSVDVAVVGAGISGLACAAALVKAQYSVDQQRMMASTATWCGDWCKVVAKFASPFWRQQGASGVAATEGPVSIWWEGGGGTETGDEVNALIGLGVGDDTAAFENRMASRNGNEELRSFVTATLGAVFGRDLVAEQLLSVRHKCWIADPLTYAKGGQHRNYGHPLLKRPTPWGVHFAGTETEQDNGHVEGAIKAGERAAAEVAFALQQQ